jgi:hypothetical protein
MGRLWQRIKWVAWESDLSYTELMLAVIYLGWAIALLTSRVFAPTHTTQTSRSFDSVAVMWVWGLLLFVIGTLKLLGLIRSNRILGAIGAVLGVFMWTFTAVVVVWAGGLSTGAVAYVVLAITCFLTLMRKVRGIRALGGGKE